MAERTYPEHLGTALDPKVFTHPVTAEPMPILVKDVSATSGGGATSVKQDALLAEVQLKRDGTDTEPVYTTKVDQTQTPSFVRSSTSSSVAAGAIHASITNVGSASGTVLGTALKAKETVHFTATDRHATLSSIAFDATGTEFVVTTLRV